MTPDEHARTVLRGAVLRDAARLASARDVLVVRVGGLDDARLVESLVCGEHWTGGMALDLQREPIVLQALAGDRLVRCCPRRPRRICGPYWSTAAIVVPQRLSAEETAVVVLAGGDQQPCPEDARGAAATVAALIPQDPVREERATWGVIVVRGEAASATLRSALTALEDDAARVVSTGVREICVLVPSGGAVACERIAEAVRVQTGPQRRAVGVGWAVGAPRQPVARALDVARSMAEQDKRAARPAGEKDD